ncbi:MAG: hypothetical protein ACKVLB_06455, partial [Burkholderiales bacterium]
LQTVQKRYVDTINS